MIILSNDDPNEQKLNWLLDGVNNASDSHGVNAYIPSTEAKVDVTLRTQLGQAPVIMLLFPLDEVKPGTFKPNDENAFRKASISLEIGPNGRVSVVDMTGLLDDEGANTETPGSQSTEATELQGKIARVFEISQDIGTLVEWILRWAQQRNGR